MANLGSAEVNFEAVFEENQKIKAALDDMVAQMDKAKNALTVVQETNNQQVVKTIAAGYDRLSNILKESPGLAENANRAVTNYQETYTTKIDNDRLADKIFEA